MFIRDGRTFAFLTITGDFFKKLQRGKRSPVNETQFLPDFPQHMLSVISLFTLDLNFNDFSAQLTIIDKAHPAQAMVLTQVDAVFPDHLPAPLPVAADTACALAAFNILMQTDNQASDDPFGHERILVNIAQVLRTVLPTGISRGFFRQELGGNIHFLAIFGGPKADLQPVFKHQVEEFTLLGGGKPLFCPDILKQLLIKTPLVLLFNISVFQYCIDRIDRPLRVEDNKIRQTGFMKMEDEAQIVEELTEIILLCPILNTFTSADI